MFRLGFLGFGFVVTFSLLGRLQAAADVPVLVQMTVDAGGPHVLNHQDQDIEINGLLRGVATCIELKIDATRITPLEDFELIKSCSCFSATVKEITSSEEGKPIALLQVITVPSNQGFTETVRFFRKSGARHDGTGSGAKYDVRSLALSLRLVGRSTSPIDVKSSDTTAPEPGESRLISVKPASDLVTIVPDSVKMTSSTLEFHYTEASTDDAISVDCRLKEKGINAEQGGTAIADRFSVDVRCDFLVQGSETVTPFSGRLDFWSGTSVRIVPPRLMVSSSDIEDGITFSVFDARGFDNDDMPYIFRFAPNFKERESVEILSSKKVSDRRWTFSISAPDDRISKLELVYKSDPESAPARAAALVLTE
jgi:hypothetical protein